MLCVQVVFGARHGKIINANLFTHVAHYRHIRALRNSFIRVRAFQIELEFRNVGF